MKTLSSSNAALGTIFLLLAIGCGSSTGSSGSNESDGGAGTSDQRHGRSRLDWRRRVRQRNRRERRK